MLLAVVLAALLGCAARTPLDQARQAWLKQALVRVEPVVEEATGTPIRISGITWMLRPRRGVCAAYWYRPGEGQGRIEFYPSTGCDLEGMRLRTLVHELAHAVHGQPAGIGAYGQEAHGEEFEAINATALRAVLREVQLPPWPGAWGLPPPRRPDPDPDKLRRVVMEERSRLAAEPDPVRRARMEERIRIMEAEAMLRLAVEPDPDR